ncbi:hypothetical protein N7G274_004640 [Stereocaulon virgatum]|uniref:Uncharacterized protein n=1 Tax=Stereocaulon virgatum TaxID=373712 RepID=A0ABR4ABJ9_9LECA
MAAPVPQPNTTTPTNLTAAQARALLQIMLSRNQNSNAVPRPTPTAARPTHKSTQTSPRPPQPQQTITIDASTRIMGHCNTVQLASPSLQEQAAKLEQLLRSAVAGSTEKAPAGVNITVQAGFNLMGSRNVVTFGSSSSSSSSSPAKETARVSALGEVRTSVKVDDQSAGRKRRAESEPVDVRRAGGKKVKVEGL